MATFVLVHGAWHGGWCWKRVREILERAGHRVFTPTLTGLADRSHLLTPDVNLSTHIADVANLLVWEELDNVVLCGHSYSGAVVTGAADREARRIRALVLLDGYFLEDGECVFDHMPEERAAKMRQNAVEKGEGWKLPPATAEALQVNPEDRAWVDSLCTPHPLAGFAERIALTGEYARIASITHIIATGFTNNSPFPAVHEAAKEKGWRTEKMACGHDVMIDMPEELAAFLMTLA